MNVDQIIFDACYGIASAKTGCKPSEMGECPDFDKVFDQTMTALYKIMEE